jgi:hypothetical protein
LGWEHVILSDRVSKTIGSGVKLATRGILLGSEFLAIGLYVLKRLSLPIAGAELKGELVLLLLSIAAIGVTLFVLRNQDPLVKEIAENMQKSVVNAPRNPGERE